MFKLLNENIDAMLARIANGTDNLTDQQIIAAMKSIQEARNNIHIFTTANTRSVEDADRNIMILCQIINELGRRIYHTSMNV